MGVKLGHNLSIMVAPLGTIYLGGDLFFFSYLDPASMLKISPPTSAFRVALQSASLVRRYALLCTYIHA